MTKAIGPLRAIALLTATAVLPLAAAEAQQVAPVAKPAQAKAAKAGKSSAQPQAEAKTANPAAAQKYLESGIKAYETGKYEPAVQSLSAALRGGGLPSQQMAKGLYYRGLAYRKQGKPAQAISDLTSALWLKGGLNDTERADAADNRAAAYREAGLGEAAPVAASAGPALAKAAEKPADKPAETKTAAAAPAPAPAPAAPVPDWSADAKPAAAARSAAAVAAPAPPPGAGLAPSSAAAQDAAPVAAAPASAAPSSGSGIGNFFSNLFSGGSSASANAAGADKQAPVTTASTTPANPQTSSWSDNTSVAESKGRKVAAASAAAAPAPVRTAALTPPAATAPAGKFRLQVAAVRSRDEAAQVIAKLKAQHSAEFGGAEPLVDETVIGNMGTFYRVRLGPYASADQPRQLCAALKPKGFDCMLVTQ